mgnify:CR=1 FL=1
MDRIQEICVVGLGYVGLPAAIAFYESGFDVLGIDISLPISGFNIFSLTFFILNSL